MTAHKNVECVGIILDGNRRWAREKGLPSLEGHRAGYAAIKSAVRLMKARGVRHLVVYAFSTENWGRTGEEVSYLMDLFRKAITEDMKELGREGVHIRILGQRERFPQDLQNVMHEIEASTAHNAAITLWCGLSYGGRAEIAAACEAAAKAGDVSEAGISRHLWTAGMPDPDIIIRPGGEKRLSNFLPWQSVYSELFFLDTYWPDFSEKEFDAILAEYASRERRHGK